MHKFFNSKDRNTLVEYFKFKEKNGHKFSEEELNVFICSVKNKILLLNNNKKYSTVFLPETGNKNLIRLANEVSENIVIIEKNDKSKIIKELDKQHFQKKEKEALYSSMENMSVIKMADIKGNQRIRFVDSLFKKINIDNSFYENSLFLDDSSFSSYTYKAAITKIKSPTTSVILFFKE